MWIEHTIEELGKSRSNRLDWNEEVEVRHCHAICTFV